MQENKGLTSAKINGKVVSSQKVLAEEYTKSFLKKIEEIQESLPNNNIVAENTFKTLVERNENEFEFREVRIKEVYKYITKSRPTKARGNCELNMFILRKIPEFAAICLTHIINNIIRTATFPKALKTSRMIPILKPNKDKNLLTS